MKNAFTLYFIFAAFVSVAQNKTIDSLRQALKSYDASRLELGRKLSPEESDTTKVHILNSLSWEFKNISDYNSAIQYAGDALAIARQIGFKRGMAFSYNHIGVVCLEQGNYPEALKYSFSALKIREEARDKNGIAGSQINIGLVYWNLGNYPEALKRFFASLKIAEETGNRKTIADNYGNIGLIYIEQGKFAEALKTLHIALGIRKEIDDKPGLAASYSNIGCVLLDMENYPEALENFLAAQKLNEEIGAKVSIATCYSNIGLTYGRQSNYTEALKYYLAALKIAEEIGDKGGVALAFQNIGAAKYELNHIAEARKWFQNGLQLALEIGEVARIRDFYDNLSTTDSALGNFKGAYENHKLFMLYRDSLANEENTRKTTQMQMQYAFDKKETRSKAIAEAELNKQKLLRNGFLAGFAVVLLFALVFFRQRNNTKKEKQRSDALLMNILPEEVADEIKQTGMVRAKAFTMVTVMFTDFKDFTLASEKISAELLVEEIHSCFSAFDRILDKYNIEKIKTIGDAYLCASGLPLSNHTHAQDILNAALEIREYMLQRKTEKEARGEIPFELRIGIHTGPVVAGVVGIRKYAYDIWGDTVNIAARMEQNSEAGKINISGTTYELVKGQFNCLHRGKIPAKNKGEIDMYFVEGIS